MYVRERDVVNVSHANALWRVWRQQRRRGKIRLLFQNSIFVF